MAFQVCGTPPPTNATRRRAPRVCRSNPSDAPTPVAPPSVSAVTPLLHAIGLPDSPTTDKAVLRAFGWSSQAYWRGELVRAEPSAEAAEKALAFLQDADGLGMNAAQACKAVQKFPEVLALPSVGDGQRMNESLEKMRQTWKLKGPVLRNAVVANPQALGYTFDCGGDCAGECARCWVRF
eukprot:CAMPEP_0198325042 /NCGR_PEP_ID=MMETSP1450-20131203/12886_1 /TAXON_ID=753684 ORGANISM="Madagascaria erythrocladiodes, Strain CCMP3234" /NCGR_SAMPLE_ID=MMETSP1450 /ASSEMBLY_ACC=CAM_ASM_001115 /LENGTH=179 /DNA_ID=CAMNT_0044028887 /DNA_START=264 /DNA_END=803 /DNA_ORIENTATION=+